MPARAALILSALLASSAAAAPAIDPQYGTHAVIQRGKPIAITGTASPNERLTVSFAGLSSAISSDATGRWTAAFPPRSAGGPFTITVNGLDGSSAANDIMIGDVWLCSGQSNMEYPLRRALNGDGEVQASTDPDLRLMKVPTQLSNTALTAFQKPPSWQVSNPDTAKDFSAACTFMVRDYRKTQRVPIGAIDDTWGGTPIRAWMSEAADRASGNAAQADLLDQYRSDPAHAVRQFGQRWSDWWRSKTGDAAGREPWNASDRLNWKPVPSLQFWDNWGPEWKAWIGSAWMRERVTLTPAEAAQAATLSLSAIDDLDWTFVNGVPVGGKNDPTNPRSYPVPAGTLKPGVNEVLVFVRNVWGNGGLEGPADQFALKFADGHSKPLATGWQYTRIADKVGDPPTPPWSNANGLSTIYNAMVAPLGHLQLKGVAWYQGEADVGQPGYDHRLAAWMGNWREQFRDPDLPFLIVGLAGWGKRVSVPTESGWAALIDEQRLATGRDPHAALASAIDLGEPNDIHPANKQEVGRRLALAGRQLAYPGTDGALGPRPLRAVRQGNDVVVTFSKPLQTLSGASANAVELCGATGGTCRYAQARATGTNLIISGDGQPVARVRYAWADYPIVNLYDADFMPAPVFELPVE